MLSFKARGTLPKPTEGMVDAMHRIGSHHAQQPTREEIVVLGLIATIGHAMALLWFVAVEEKWKITEKVVYDMPIKTGSVATRVNQACSYTSARSHPADFPAHRVVPE